MVPVLSTNDVVVLVPAAVPTTPDVVERLTAYETAPVTAVHDSVIFWLPQIAATLVGAAGLVLPPGSVGGGLSPHADSSTLENRSTAPSFFMVGLPARGGRAEPRGREPAPGLLRGVRSE